MFLLRHKYAAPMLILDDNLDWITKKIWEDSESIPINSKRVFFAQELDCCDLDPGGILFYKTPWIKFNIDKYQFSIQLSRAGEMLKLLEGAKERIEGYLRFPVFGMYVILPKTTMTALKLKLKEIEMSDEGLFAELEEINIKSRLLND